jgi:endonuclease/exonuclease/phosphatase family metal-dependent hydrolase
MDRDGFGFGNALLSRWPIIRREQVMLHGRKETGEGRLALFADVDGPRGRVPFFCTHLNWRYEHSHIRQRQVADLARFADCMRPWTFPPVLCGDFNAEPASEEIRMLLGLTTCPVDGLVFHDAWDYAGGDGQGATWDNANPYAAADFEPDRRIDYIFVGRPAARGAGHVLTCRVTGDRPVNGVWPSDHHAVLAELRY